MTRVERQVVNRHVVVLKLGGELLEGAAQIRRIARVVARVVCSTRLVIVHGGGKEIDAALATAGISKQQVDGLRVTDAATLQVVVATLAGLLNTTLTAALVAAGAGAVGLTGADGGMGAVRRARRYRSSGGTLVDLGRVGEPPFEGPLPLLRTLVRERFVPVVACIGATRRGELMNVNADTLAGSLAARLGAYRLVMAGTTAGVLNAHGQTIPSLTGTDVSALVNAGTASAGMIAKLRACAAARAHGVRDVIVAPGRHAQLAALVTGHATSGPWTRLL